MKSMKSARRDELQTLPAIGPSLAADLRLLGVTSIENLARRDPERLYAKLCDRLPADVRRATARR